MQLVNRAQFVNITFLFLLFGVAAVPVFATAIGPLTFILSFGATAVPVFVTAIVPLIYMQASL